MAALPFVGGCAELPLAAQQEIAAAQQAYSRRDLSLARSKLDGVLQTYRDYPGTAEAHYLRAKILAESSDRRGALRDALRCIELSKDDDLTAKAHAMAGSLEFELGNRAAASPHFAKALRRLPEKPPTDLIRYRYAICLQQEGAWHDAKKQFALVLQRYPGGDLAEHARRMSEWPGNYHAIQCGAFRDRKAADLLAGTLNSAGQKARVEPMQRSGETLYMVYVGYFPTYGEAEAALGSVKRRVSGAVIVP